MNELSIGFSKLRHEEIASLAAAVHLALTTAPANAYFPAPVPSPADLQTANAALLAALALETSTSSAALRKARRDEVTGLLYQLAANLELTAKGDLAKLAASGFELKKKPGGRSETPTPVPANLRVKPTGISGQALGKVGAVAGADGYQGQSALSPDGPWTDLDPVSNSQKILFTGLGRGKDYYFRVRALGPNGPSGWSDIASMMIV